MKKLRYLKNFILRKIVSLDKKGFFYALNSVYKNSMIRRLNVASDFSWSTTNIPVNPTKFEDIITLFFCAPLSRGVLRQDIDEAALLYKVVSQIESPIGIEIGRFYGGSTILLSTAIGPTGKLISIDISPKDNDSSLKDQLVKTNLADRVELIIGDANEIDIDLPIDFVFIDGDHSYEGARRDHNKWGAKIKQGGYIIHHDMGNNRPHSVQWNDLKLLYKDILKEQSNFLEIYALAGSMVIFRKKSSHWLDLNPKKNYKATNTEGVAKKLNSYLDLEKAKKL